MKAWMAHVASEKLQQAIQVLRTGLTESRVCKESGDHVGALMTFTTALEEAEDKLLSALLWMDRDENAPVTLAVGTGGVGHDR